MRKVLVTFLILLVFAVVVPAQAPDTLWSHVISISPNGDIDDGKCVRQTSDGGYIITGSTVPNGMISCIDLLLLKTDADGLTEWIRTYHRDYIEEGLSVLQTPDGGYAIAGRSLFITGSIPANDHHSDAWLLKTDIYGDTVWTTNYGGDGNDYFTSIVQTEDSGYLMAGTYNSGTSYPDYEVDEEFPVDSSNVWLIKTDSEGDTLWTKTYLDFCHGNCVIEAHDSGYIITGWIFPDEPDRQSEVLLIKTDSMGDTIWTRTIGGTGNEIGFNVRKTVDGYIIIGQTKPLYGDFDAYLIKTDFSGNVQWTNTFGGSLHDAGSSIEVTNDGGFIITGTINGDFIWVHGGDMWIFKTDSNGNLLWENIYDHTICDYAWCGIQTFDLGYVVTGLLGYGFGGDLWLAKLAPETSVPGNYPSLPLTFKLHQNNPNPFNNETIISFTTESPGYAVVEIYNMEGKLVNLLGNEFYRAGTHSIDYTPENLTSGVYFYNLKINGQHQTKKMILLK